VISSQTLDVQKINAAGIAGLAQFAVGIAGVIHRLIG
jgi:hypothetical protein